MSALIAFPVWTKPARKLPVVREEQKSSYVVYRGPSALNGEEIIVVLTGLVRKSLNEKTGSMAQLWILPANLSPNEAQKTGDDASVCGDCPLRPSLARKQGTTSCYVTTYQGPRSVWASQHASPVEVDSACEALRRSGLALRIGAYGDPAAIPESSQVLQKLASVVARWTGYTHQWRCADAWWLRGYCMASVDDVDEDRVIDELHAAHVAGWRTFRITRRDAPQYAPSIEAICPSFTHGTKCADCGLCQGNLSARTKSLVIPAHGIGAKR